MTTLDILCRVVDNLGDIGFVYRLARALSELSASTSRAVGLRLRLVVDDLPAFASICPGIDPESPRQFLARRECPEPWEVVRWDNPGGEGTESFSVTPPRYVVECYACGRPSWLEEILFDSGGGEPRFLVDLEYLTAESWSAEYHLLPSLTRSSGVKKTIFMPGFLKGTGGLIQDRPFMDALAAFSNPDRRAGERSFLLRELGAVESLPPDADPPGTSAFWFLLFSYEHDFSGLVKDLAAFARDREVVVFAASGRSAEPLKRALDDAFAREETVPFTAVFLPMLAQETWDRLLAASDFAVVRGEESLSRAVLAGKPFLWECYPFKDGDGERSGHFPKVLALHDLLRNEAALLNGACLGEDYLRWEALSLDFNGMEGGRGDFLGVLRSLPAVEPAFRNLSQKVLENGNLAVNLMTFLGISG